MIEKIEKFVDKLRKVSHNVSYLAKLLSYVANCFANIPKSSDTKE